MEATAKARYIRSTARKARLVVDEVRGMSVVEALNLLTYSIQKTVAVDVKKVVQSAVANLQNNNQNVNIDESEILIKEIRVDEGPMLKRFQPRSQGRAYGIKKRMCHISVTVAC